MIEGLQSESVYIERAQAGDNAAFGILYDHYSKPLYRFIAVKVATREEAEDLLHEVFLSAWRKLPSFKAQGFPFGSWLYKIARNRVIDHYRTKKQVSSIDDEDSPAHVLADSRASVEESIDSQLDLRTVSKALHLLTDEQREVIEMRFVSDLSPAEIAEITGRREGTIRIIQFRALKRLKQALAQEE